MKIEVYPYGPESERHFQELSAQGLPWGEASSQSTHLSVEWPSNMRLPVVGDGFSVDWAHGHVTSASFHFEEGLWYFTVHLGPR